MRRRFSWVLAGIVTSIPNRTAIAVIRCVGTPLSPHEYYVLQRLVDKIARFCGFLIRPIYERNDRGTLPIPDAEAFTKNVLVLRIQHWSDCPFHGYAFLHVSTEDGCRSTSPLPHAQQTCTHPGGLYMSPSVGTVVWARGMRSSNRVTASNEQRSTLPPPFPPPESRCMRA
jgi:hypothetical protein